MFGPAGGIRTPDHPVADRIAPLQPGALPLSYGGFVNKFIAPRGIRVGGLIVHSVLAPPYFPRLNEF